MDQTLTREATERGLSVNNLINVVLSRYSEWGRFDEKVHNVSFSASQIKQLFEHVPEESLETLSLAEAEGFANLSKFVLGSFELKSLLALFERIGKNSGIWSIEKKLQDEHLIFFLCHNLGNAYSEHLARSIKKTLERLRRTGDEIEFSEYVVKLKILISRDLMSEEDDSVPLSQAEMRKW